MNIFIVKYTCRYLNGDSHTWLSSVMEPTEDTAILGAEKAVKLWSNNLQGDEYTFEVIEYTPLQK